MKQISRLVGKHFQFLSLFFLFIFFSGIGWGEEKADTKQPHIRIVYFTPSDGTPAPGAPARLFRVISHIQEFYRSEMERAGYGPISFIFDTDPENDSQLLIHYVTGHDPALSYSRGDYGKIRKEVTEALTKGTNGLAPIHPDSEIVIVFQRLLTVTEEGGVYQHGPIVGAGNHLFGIALAMDDERLDPEFLTSDVPADQNGTMSLGEFNTRYIGALAHELGHAFGLLHNAETDRQRRNRGWSLMGLGNNYYGAQLRGDGKGAFLTDADTLRLSRCRAFAGDLPFAFTRPKWRIVSLKGEFQRDDDGEPELFLKGKIESNLKLAGLILYNDDALIPGDYDAKSFITQPKEDGSFEMTITELAETDYQLRIAGLYENGAVSGAAVTYSIDTDLSYTGLERLNNYASEMLIRRLFECWNVERLKDVIREEETREGGSQILVKKGKHLLRRMTDPPKPVPPAEISDDINEWKLSEAVWENARNGVDLLLRDRVPEDLFIMVGGDFYDSGLFAHAPSVHRFRLGKKWSEFYTEFGIADGHCGSVRCRVLGDSKELFTGPVIRDHRKREIALSVEGIDILDLVVEPTDDGNSHDWGIWIDPRITR